MEMNDSAEAQKNYLGRTVVRISVVMLGVGFSLLGFLSPIKNHHLCSETGITLEDAFSIFGGITSFLLGGIFLIPVLFIGTVWWQIVSLCSEWHRDKISLDIPKGLRS